MRAGPLNQVVELQKQVRTKTDDGGVDVSWVSVPPKVWAAVEPIGGREANRANQTIASTETRIRIRYSLQVADIDATWRVLHGAAIYDIKRIVNTRSANTEIELTCEAGVNDG